MSPDELKAMRDDWRLSRALIWGAKVRARDEYLRALILLNGGGAVALGAFLGQIWGDGNDISESSRILLFGAIYGFLFNALGLVCALLSKEQWWRVLDGEEHERWIEGRESDPGIQKWKEGFNQSKSAHHYLRVFSLIAFVTSLFFVGGNAHKAVSARPSNLANESSEPPVALRVGE